MRVRYRSAKGGGDADAPGAPADDEDDEDDEEDEEDEDEEEGEEDERPGARRRGDEGTTASRALLPPLPVLASAANCLRGRPQVASTTQTSGAQTSVQYATSASPISRRDRP